MTSEVTQPRVRQRSREMAPLSSLRSLGSQAASWPWALGLLTFLAVMLVVVEDEAAATLALIAAEGVDAVLLAAAVVLGALVLVCREQEGRACLCMGQGQWHPKGSGGPGRASSPPWGRQGGERRSRRWWGSGALPHAEPAEGPQLCGEKVEMDGGRVGVWS